MKDFCVETGLQYTDRWCRYSAVNWTIIMHMVQLGDEQMIVAGLTLSLSEIN